MWKYRYSITRTPFLALKEWTLTVGLNRIWENEKMNQANGYHSSPDPYVGNQKAPKREKFHELIWRTLRFFLALSINYTFLGL